MAWLAHSIAEDGIVSTANDYGLTPEGAHEQFADYLRAYDATG
jgi:hypothetical protein